MKIIFASILSLVFFISHGQGAKITATPIQIVNRNFKVYISTDDNSPSWKIRKEMLDALTQLQQSVNEKKDFPLLVNVWMYYTPTDFPTRDLVGPIFNKHKVAALQAIDQRLQHKKKWEDKGTAPYSELIELQKQLLN
ncbi:MAG: hypothetical protein ABI402_07960 [Ferruginibacter sp.]